MVITLLLKIFPWSVVYPFLHFHSPPSFQDCCFQVKGRVRDCASVKWRSSSEWQRCQLASSSRQSATVSSIEWHTGVISVLTIHPLSVHDHHCCCCWWWWWRVNDYRRHRSRQPLIGWSICRHRSHHLKAMSFSFSLSQSHHLMFSQLGVKRTRERKVKTEAEKIETELSKWTLSLSPTFKNVMLTFSQPCIFTKTKGQLVKKRKSASKLMLNKLSIKGTHMHTLKNKLTSQLLFIY